MKEINQTHSEYAEELKKKNSHIFDAVPFPKERDEEWRYTNIDKFNLQKFSFSDMRMKIFAAGLSEDLVEKGVILTDINTALENYDIAKEYLLKNLNAKNDKFIAMNLSFFENGFFLYVPKNVELSEPIKITHNLENQNGILFNLIVIDSESSIDFIEEYSNSETETENEQLHSCITNVHVLDNSKLNFYHLNNWTKNVYNFTNIIGTIGRDSSLNWISGCFGGKLNRLKIDTIFEGQGSQCNNLGIFLGKGKEHIDFTTNMYHNNLNTVNDVLVDGILKDESTSVYRGLIKIPKQGQKTNSYLANHILKLGEKTIANSIPSLKIDANDVKASHGATVGQINEEHLFYLMARGLSKEEAEKLIIEGFFEPIIQKIPLEELREKIRERVRW